jgi:hypothetical protein
LGGLLRANELIILIALLLRFLYIPVEHLLERIFYMSLNLNPNPSPSTSAYYTSPTFTEAVNDAQLVRTFSIVALAGSILIFIGGAVAIGIGLAVIGLGGTRYYRFLGLAVIVLGVLGFLIGPFRIIASSVLAGGVIWKAIGVLGVLQTEGKGDPDWEATRRQAITAMVVSGIALVVNAIWLTIMLIGLFMMSQKG